MVDLSDVGTQELADELDDRGWLVQYSGLTVCETDELVDELKSRRWWSLDQKAEQLYNSWLLDSPAEFQNSLKKFFHETMGVIEK